MTVSLKIKKNPLVGIKEKEEKEAVIKAGYIIITQFI